jgi:predicted O-methyltransferase YrrM
MLFSNASLTTYHCMTQQTLSTTSPDDFESAWQHSIQIEGWLTREQGLALFRAARSAPPGTRIVEIGSHHGRSTVLLAKAAGPEVSVLAVDPYEDLRWGGGHSAYEVFCSNLERAAVRARVEVHRGTSERALPEYDQRPIGMLYIDGAHDLPSVLIDIDGWEPFMVDGAIVAIHDAFSSIGVTRAILKRHLFNRSFKYVGSVRSLALFQRQKLSAWSSASSAVRICGRLAYFVRNGLVKLARRRGWQWPQRALGHHDPSDPY